MTLIVVAVVFMKLAIAAGIGTVGTGSSLTAAYMLGAFDPGDANLPETVEKFKQGEVGDCVKGYFPGFDVTKATTSGTTVSLPDNFPTTSESDLAKSCLVVNWEKENFSDSTGHGTGSFRGLGSFVQGDKGFVMFNVASTSTEENKMELQGVLYVLEKNDSGVWTEKDGSKDASATKKVTENDFDDSFPKVSDSTMKDEFSSSDRKDGWDFVKKDDMKNLCKSGDTTKCKTSSGKESFKGLWTWESSSGGTVGSLTSGSNNLDKGVPNLYSSLDLKSKLSSLKGTWNKEFVFKLPKPNGTGNN